MGVVAVRPKRTALSLNAATDATLAKLASLQRRPKATVIADLLDEMQPALSRIATLLETAMATRHALPSATEAKLEALQDLLGHTATFGLDRMDGLLGGSALPERPARRAGARKRPKGH